MEICHIFQHAHVSFACGWCAWYCKKGTRGVYVCTYICIVYTDQNIYVRAGVGINLNPEDSRICRCGRNLNVKPKHGHGTDMGGKYSGRVGGKRMNKQPGG